jgi:DNA-binding transcriptional MerR regulator
MSDLMMRNQILGLRRAGMSVEEVSAALEIDPAVVRLALEATGGSSVLRAEARKEDSDVTDDVSEAIISAISILMSARASCFLRSTKPTPRPQCAPGPR